MYSGHLVNASDLSEVSCVYEITHKDSDKAYIGRTYKLRERAMKHLSELSSGRHKNPKMLNLSNKYGVEGFVIKALVVGSPEYCEEIEGKLLANIDLKTSLNCHKNSNGGWLGLKFSEESRQRLSAAKKGHVISEEAKEKIKITRLTSPKWKSWMTLLKTPEYVEKRVNAAKTPESRAKAIQTRGIDNMREHLVKYRKIRQDKAKANAFNAFDWAYENNATKSAAVEKFGVSWGSVKICEPEWEELRGHKLPGRTRKVRQLETPEHKLLRYAEQSKRMSGENNPMFGKTHSPEAKAIISAVSAITSKGRRHTEETKRLLSNKLKGMPKPAGKDSPVSKAINTPEGVFYCIKEASSHFGITDGAIIWRCKNQSSKWASWSYVNKVEEAA